MSPGQVIPNSAEVRWTSLDGDPGQRSTFTPDSTERTGAGGVNDYVAADGADINILNVELSKIGGGHLGERDDRPRGRGRGRDRSLPRRGRHPGVRHPDELPVRGPPPGGDELHRRGNGRIALVSDAGDNLVSSTLTDPDPAAPPDLYLTGDETNVATLVPQFPIPANLVTFATVNGRTQVTFDLGLVTNPAVPDENDFEFVVVEFNVLVTNVAGEPGRDRAGERVSSGQNGVDHGHDRQRAAARRRAGDHGGGQDRRLAGRPRTHPRPASTTPATGSATAVGYANDVGAERLDGLRRAAASTPLPAAKMTLDPASIVVFRNGVQITTGFTINSGRQHGGRDRGPGRARGLHHRLLRGDPDHRGRGRRDHPEHRQPDLDQLARPQRDDQQSDRLRPHPAPPAAPPASGTAPAAINDYAGSDDATIEILAAAAHQVHRRQLQRLHGPPTSSTPTLTDLAIGEAVLYQFTITLPGGDDATSSSPTSSRSGRTASRTDRLRVHPRHRGLVPHPIRSGDRHSRSTRTATGSTTCSPSTSGRS